MARPLKTAARRFRRLLLPLLFVLIAASVFPTAWRAAERSNTREVEASAPEWLPVLVFAGEEVELLWPDELALYKRAHPEYSFRAPEGRDEELNRRLVASYRKRRRGADAFPKFEVKRLTPERQLFELGLHGDGELVVWYEATDKETFPVRYTSMGPLSPVTPLFWSGLVSAVACGVCYGLWRIYRDAKRS
ncbi:MAG: hypothetical protein JOZ96_22830 [Acidobacteria bacterium]|nr:hypothetical protein [Acidobacteriota bacterium]